MEIYRIKVRLQKKAKKERMNVAQKTTDTFTFRDKDRCALKKPIEQD